MESVTGRRAARCVAVFYLIGSCILILLFVTLLTIFWSDLSTSERRNQDNLVWLILFACAIFIKLGVWFSVILMKATSCTVEPKKRLHLTESWIHFNFIFFLLGVISLVFSKMKVFTGICLVVQLVFILIVHHYKRHLQKKIDESEPDVKFDSKLEETA